MSMMTFLKKYFKQNRIHMILLLMGLILAIVSVWHWFSGNSIIYFVDTLLPVDTKNSFVRVFYNIDTRVFPWNIEASWSWFIYWLMISIGKETLGNLSASQFVLYVFLLFSSILSFYLLANHLWTLLLKGKNSQNYHRVISFLFALFYTFNLYTFYYAFFTFNPDAYIVAFLPLNMLALFKVYPLGSTKAEKNVPWTIIFFLTLIMMSPGFLTYIFIAQYLVWVSLYLLINFIFQIKKIVLKEIVALGTFFMLILLSIWWWFFPALLILKDVYEQQSSTGTISWFNQGFIPSQLLNVFRTLGIPLMNGNPFSWSTFYTDNRFFTLPLFLLPFLILFFVSKLRKFKNRNTFLYLLIMLLVSIFIVKFSNPPFAFLNRFAFEYIPFFGAFRDSYHKAGMFYHLALFSVACMGAGLAFKYLLEKRNKTLLVLSLGIIIAFGIVVTGPFFLFSSDNLIKYNFLFNHKPHSVSSKTQIPPEYYQLKKVFEPQCQGKDVMIIPRGGWISNAEWEKYGNSYVGVDLIPRLINCSFITTLAYKPMSESSNQAIYLLLQNKDYDGYKQFILKNQIPFVLVRYDHVPYYPSTWQYIDPKIITKRLDSDPDFERKIINDYFTVYRFKPLDKLNNYGIALSSHASYTNSFLAGSVDYAMLSRKTPDVIGPAVLNPISYSDKYKSLIDTYIAEGICDECAGKGEIERMDIGTNTKHMQFKFNIVQDGQYACEGKVYVPGSEITDLSVSNSSNKKVVPNESKLFPLSRGQYTSSLSYSSQVFINKDSVSIPKGAQSIEFPVSELTGRSFKLSYDLDSREQEVEVILAKKHLSDVTLKEKELKQEDIEFVSPTGPSDKTQSISRIFQIDEFNPYKHSIYIRSVSNGLSKRGSGVIRNLMIESAIDTNYVNFSCVTKSRVASKDFTRILKITQVNPIEYILTLPKSFYSGFITFNKTYANGWQAYSIENGKKRIFAHIQSGYGNAWYVENPKDRRITIVYEQHELITKNGIVTFIAFSILLIIFIKLKKNND